MDSSLDPRLPDDPREAARELLARIRSVPAQTRRAVFAHVQGEEELARAFAVSRASGGPLSGVPVLVKDLFDEAGVATRAGSTFLADVRPVPVADGALVRDVRERGAVVAGRTQLNEFAYGLEGRNAHHGDVPHPRDATRLSGGSSSGSAWAVAAGVVPLAFGTDTGGSIRLPAATCGLYGWRGSPGPWSTEGCFPLAPSFDTAGWFTRDAAAMAAALRALDPVVSGSLPTGPGLWFVPPGAEPRADVVAEGERLARSLGAVSPPASVAALSEVLAGAATTYLALTSTEALVVHRDWLDQRRDAYDPVTWQRIARGRTWSRDQLAEAAAHRRRLLDVLAEVFVEHAFVALPAIPEPPPPVAGLDDGYRRRCLTLSSLGSLAGCPALVIPHPTAQHGLTAGVQFLVARQGSVVPLGLLG